MASRRRVVFLLGKPPRENTVFPEVFARLEAGGVEVTVHLPHDEPVPPEALDRADLVVHRGLDGRALGRLGELHGSATPLCNPYPGTVVLGDRARLAKALSAFPSPASTIVPDWEQVRAATVDRTMVVKAARGPGRGRSVTVGAAHELPEQVDLDGPFVVQEYVPNAGVDHKVYVIGDQVRGLTKPSSLTEGHHTGGAPFRPNRQVRELVLEIGAALDLHFYGVDLLLGPDGPVVVDVNDFPGYRGVADAAALVAAHIGRA